MPPPVLTPGISDREDAAAARGPLFISSGSCCSVSGEMPCSWVAVVLRTDDAADRPRRALLGPDRQRDVDALHLSAERHVDVGKRDLLEAVLDRVDRVLRRRQVAERVLAVGAGDRGRDRLVGGDVPERQRHVGDDAARRVPDDAGDGAVEALGRGGRRDQQRIAVDTGIGSDGPSLDLPYVEVEGTCATPANLSPPPHDHAHARGLRRVRSNTLIVGVSTQAYAYRSGVEYALKNRRVS